jgi:radical SAM superfamily enzyme YgiQ (UPF0313 family)
MNVLISVPTFPLSGMRYLPLVWACLKSYHDHKGKYPEKINWLPPLKNSVDIENFLKSNVKVDVLGLSNYMWNSKINTYLTEEIKKRNPNCFVICGGPEFDTTNKKNFGKLIDLYVPIEGEATFSALLDRFVKNQDWRDVGGIVYRGKDKVIKTPPLPWIRDWEYSPLLDHKEYMSEVVEENASLGLKTLLQFETTRGCPYSCTYCDWGGGIHTKIRQRPVDILQKEIEWSGQNKIWKYFITDANFGILKRDIEVAKIIVDTKKEYGYPRGVLYQTAKNQTEQIVEIADIFYKGTVSSGHMMSMQSTDETVLANVKRSNLPAERQKKIAEMLHERGVPVKSQLIIGLPGDTIKTLKDSVTYLYEMGVSYEVENFILGLFPNAPAADPKYRKEMQFKTTSAYSGVICRDITTGQGYNGYDLATCNGMDHDDQSAYADTLWSETEDKSELVIGSYSFDEREWANMFSWLNIFNGLVELGIFKFLSDFYNENGVSYKTFIHRFLELLVEKDPLFAEIYHDIFNQTLKFSMKEKEYAEVTITGYNDTIGFDMSVVIQSWIAEHKEHISKKWPKIIQDEFGYFDMIPELFEFSMDYIVGYDTVEDFQKTYNYNWKKLIKDKNYISAKPKKYTIKFNNTYIRHFKKLNVKMDRYYYAMCLVYGKNRKLMNYKLDIVD